VAHSHGDITDVLYLSLRRSRQDHEASAKSIWKNSGFEYDEDEDGFQVLIRPNIEF
jgi:hypothetical protein